MAAEPHYWNQLNFVDWSHNGDGMAEDDFHKLSKLVGGRDIELAVLRAENPRGLSLFKELKARIEDNCARKPYESSKQEATRMAWAREDLATSTNPAHLVSAAFRLHEGEKGFPAVPEVKSIVVERIAVLRNLRLWHAYFEARSALALKKSQISESMTTATKLLKQDAGRVAGAVFPQFPMLDEAIGESLLFHGTDATRYIVDSNIDPKRGRDKNKNPENPNYGLLGQGSYFSDRIAKSGTYTLCRLCKGFKCNCTTKAGGPVLRKTLLARVLLGKVHFAPTASVVWDSGGLRPQGADESLPNGSDSIIAAGLKDSLRIYSPHKFAAGTNEIAVRKSAQIYPEFIIYWHHPSPAKPYADLWDNASRLAMKAVEAKREQRPRFWYDLEERESQ